MSKWIHQLWADDHGFLVSSELMLIASICILAMLVGLSEVSNAVNAELSDVAHGFDSMNQSHRYSQSQGHHGRGQGGQYNDQTDDSSADFGNY